MGTVQYSCDYYELLGLQPDFADAELHSAYRRAASMYHPDRNKSSRASAMMGLINEAYAVLGDPQQKREYHAAWSRGDRGARRSPLESESSASAYSGAVGGEQESAEEYGGRNEWAHKPFDAQQHANTKSLPAGCWGLLGLLGLVAVIPDPPLDILAWVLLISSVIWLLRRR